MHTKFVLGNLKRRDHLECISIDEGKKTKGIVVPVLNQAPRHKDVLGHMWENNVEMDLLQTGCEDVDWIHLFLGRAHWCALLNMVMHHVP
jgi:hypothetical protein